MWTQNVTGAMEAIRILDKKENLNRDYDEEADVPYISIGEPQNVLGVDIGEGASSGISLQPVAMSTPSIV